MMKYTRIRHAVLRMISDGEIASRLVTLRDTKRKLTRTGGKLSAAESRAVSEFAGGPLVCVYPKARITTAWPVELIEAGRRELSAWTAEHGAVATD